MTDVSVSRFSRFRVWVTRRSVGCLLMLWLALYGGVGLIFAILYRVPGCAVAVRDGCCESSFWRLLYFSFTTQSTLGYGDYAPIGSGRWLSVGQVVIGLAMNAVVLGIVVFKALKHSKPLKFGAYLVYEMEKHKFWFRFINVDFDKLRDVDFRVQFVQPAGSDNIQTDYDTRANVVEMDVPQLYEMGRLHLFANRSKSNDGIYKPPGSDRKEALVLSPAHFSGPESGRGEKYVEITGRGYFESTGDVFYYSQQYWLKDIRCGSFDDLDNTKLKGKSDKEKEREISKKFDRVLATPNERCIRCPYHPTCEFDIAAKIRSKQT